MIKDFFNFNIIKTFLIFQFITRIILSIYALVNNQILFIDFPIVFGGGFFSDLITICYFWPFVAILNITLRKIFINHNKIYQVIYFISYFSFILALTFISIAELIFWDEFGTRFNFLAVDYLIYTKEIIGTLKQSLPMGQILSAMILFNVLVIFIFRKTILNQLQKFDLKKQVIYIFTIFVISSISYKYYNSSKLIISSNKYADNLSKNGPYEFVAAFFNNSLDYDRFYPQVPAKKALEIVRTNILQSNEHYLNEETLDRINQPFKGEVKKEIFNNDVTASQTLQPLKQWNIILITVESLSAEFMGKFGNTANITPNLDRLAEEGLFFTNMYASGTRTVRGLEAITLSIPPTPGSSIIRRPNNYNLFNIGSVLKKQGYELNFIYGGYSYFDNLKNYFEGNGYNILDRYDLSSHEISSSNIWGVADEDIFIKSLKLYDQNYKEGKPFFSLIMTTSNHRPYTFPPNRIDLPSGSRYSAVKYTDFAINKFIEEAKKHPWFDNTIFIITADHCAASAGKTDLPIDKYHIPLIIYAPKLLKPQKFESLASQIDIAPTILGLLNIEYKSKFFGTNIINYPQNRAFISTYQLLGYMKNDHLIILAPNTKPKTYKLIGNRKEEINNLEDLVNEAISFYQAAYDFYINNKMLDFKN